MILQMTRGALEPSPSSSVNVEKELPTYTWIRYYRDMAIYGNGNLSQGHSEFARRKGVYLTGNCLTGADRAEPHPPLPFVEIIVVVT